MGLAVRTPTAFFAEARASTLRGDGAQLAIFASLLQIRR